MTTYHIGINGASACRARVNPCPLGGHSGKENHFDSKIEAVKFHQSNLESEHGLLKTSKKAVETSKIDGNPESSKSNTIDLLLEPLTINFDEKSPTVQQFVETSKHFYNKDVSVEIVKFYETLRNGEVPETLPDSVTSYNDSNDTMTAITLNSHMQKCGMYGKILKDTADDIAKNVGDGVVLDPMAGKGWAAKALREAGVKTIATDNNSWKISKDIENLDALESLKKYGSKTTHLLISWAPYGSDIDVKLLRECRENFPHITIINIGEGAGGCTGSGEFWDEFEDMQPENQVRYETTDALHDEITFGK